MTTTLSLKDLTIVKNEICPIIEIFLNDPTKIQPFSFAIKSGDDKIDVDLEFIKNDNREGVFDPRKMSESTKENILNRLSELETVIQSQ